MTLNLHSHSRADLSRNHKVLDELTAMVEQVCDSTEVSTERAAFMTAPDEDTPELRAAYELRANRNMTYLQFVRGSLDQKLPCHGANQAHDAGVESFQGQFEGDEE